MKTTFKMSRYFILASLAFFFSCSSDDNGGGSSGINVQNFIASFDENPMNGASVGIVQASSGNTLSFSITSQTPSGALAINPNTGELTVANAALFDYETNPVINASISIIDPSNTASATAAINLNNLDDIASFLSTSEAAYTAAANGEWVMITEAEYNALATSLNDVTKVATTDAEYDTSVTINSAASNYTLAHNNGITMPNSSYVFAFKYNAITNNVVNTKVKQSSTSVTDGYADLGGNLPSHNTGDQFFVLKGSNSPTTAVGFLAIYESNGMGWISHTGSTVEESSGDNNTLTSITETNIIFLYQGLSTTQKQW